MRQDERLVRRWPANRRQGRLARGGALFLTDTRLVFRPHRFERALGGHPWEAELEQLAAADVMARTDALFDGGLVERLRIRLRDGTVELFVVDEPSQVAADVHACLPGPSAPR